MRAEHGPAGGTALADPSLAVRVRCAVVTMDRHAAAAAARAQGLLRERAPGLTLELFAASDWSEDPNALPRCLAAIEAADVVVASMLFQEDHFRPVLAAIEAGREARDATAAIMCAPDLAKLTKLGRFDPAKSDGSSGAAALLKRLRGPKNKTGGAASAGAKQMATLRRLPRLLRFVPGPAQDLRAYLMCMRYWLAGSDANLAGLVALLVDRYADGPRRALRGRLKPAPVVESPDVGLYHPRLPGLGVTEDAALLPKPALAKGAARRGRAGLLVLRSYVLSGDRGHYDGAIEAFERQGLEVVPAFAQGLDARAAIERYFLDADGEPAIDVLVSLTGFSLVGGPAYNDAAAAAETLSRLGVPYLAAHALEFQSLERWRDSAAGLSPVEATLMVAIPELDGAVCPTVYGGRSHGGAMEAEPERAERLASRAARLVDLRKKAAVKRKLAVVLFNFPPNAGATGTAAFLSVFESLFNTLQALKAEGYAVEVPAGVDELRDKVLDGNAARFGTDANVAARISVAEHVANEPHLAEIEAAWGPAPGRQLADGASILVQGASFGNVFVGVQPGFGFEGDPMRLLFEGGRAPTHAFSAFYRYLREAFGADALLHFGTHGALEFMPGKQVGLGGGCWPERLIGDVPHFYLYAANNPSEGALAKRRSAATLVSYVTPSLARSGLYKGLSELKATLERHRKLGPEASIEAIDALNELAQAQAAALDLCEPEPLWHRGEAAGRVDRLAAQLVEVEASLIPEGLRVLGRPEGEEARAGTLAAMLDAGLEAEGLTPEGLDLPAAASALARGRSAREAAGSAGLAGEAPPLFECLERAARLMARDHELPGLMRALDGRFVPPAPGGDVVREPAVLPGGRNPHGFDPYKLPSAFAMLDGAAQAERLLERHKADGGAFPETVALVLWGTDNLKTEGAPVAQALALLGAKPRFDSYGRLAGAALKPLEELGRPRVDVLVTLSGIFRDLLPLQTKLLAEAAYLAASADEPSRLNPIRAHSLAHAARCGCDLETAALRVFSNAEGAYGSQVGALVEEGSWEDADELAGAYQARKGFAYGRDGNPVRQAELLAAVLEGVDLAYQNLESVELGVTTVDHYFDTLGGIGRAVRVAKRRAGRGDAEAPVYVGDQTSGARGAGKVRSLSEQVALETRTRALNPKWHEAMLAHGFEGVRQIEAHVTNTLGWSATTGQVQPWVYRRLAATFVLDDAMRERMASLNPKASARVARRLLEAHDRAYWNPEPDELDALVRAGEELDDRVEGVIEGAAA